MLPSAQVPAWQASLLQSLIEWEDADVVLWTLGGSNDGPAQANPIYRAFRRVEDRLPHDVPDALAPHPVMALVDGICGLAGPAGVRARDLDVLLALTGLEELSKAGIFARYGLWYFEAGDRALDPADGSMAGFHEVLCRNPGLSGSLRIRLERERRDRIAVSTHSAVNPRSHLLTRNEHLWKCSSFVVRALRASREAGPTAYLDSLPAAPIPTTARFRPSLSLAFCRYVLWRVRKLLEHRVWSERWILLWSDESREPASGKFRPLQPPAGRFWADPHVIEVDGTQHIFFEDASRDSWKGHIAHLSRAKDGTFSATTPVIERPYHLSYPFVFAWQGEYFIIPESAENRTVELYRCKRFPDQWEFVHNMMEGIRAFDATLVEHGGRWWMFANVSGREGTSSWDELCIFHSDSPLSREWRAHSANPVVSDVRSARPAGRFFRDGADLIRPSQDSSGHYGRALVFNRVLELSEKRYRELPVKTVEADWDKSVLGIHSYSCANAFTVIDAIRRELQ